MCVVLLFSASCRRAEPETVEFQSVRSIAGPESGIGEPFGVAVKGDEVFVSDGLNGKIRRISGGVMGEFANGLGTPSGIAFGPNGDLIVADSGSNSVKRIVADGTVSELASVPSPVGIAVAANGDVFVTDTYHDKILRISNGGVSTYAGGERGFADGPGLAAKFGTPLGLAMWGERLLVADAGNARIRVVEADGSVWTLAGTGGESELRDGTLASASFVEPTAIAVGPGKTRAFSLLETKRLDGDLFACDGYHLADPPFQRLLELPRFVDPLERECLKVRLDTLTVVGHERIGNTKHFRHFQLRAAVRYQVAVPQHADHPVELLRLSANRFI